MNQYCDCEKCYRYLNCWACAKADIENNKTCGILKLRKHRVDCFQCAALKDKELHLNSSEKEDTDEIDF